MEFIKALKEKEFSYIENKVSHLRYRKFEPILIKESLWLSIQASVAHQCKPKYTYDDLDFYTHWEIAVFDLDDFLKVSDISPQFRSLAELELHEDGGVYSCVPVDLVEELYLALK